LWLTDVFERLGDEHVACNGNGHGQALRIRFERTRASSVAWMPDNSGFFYTRLPKKGDVAEGQEMYNRHVFYHALGADPAQDGVDLWRGAPIRRTGRMFLFRRMEVVLIGVSQGWTKSEAVPKRHEIASGSGANFDRLRLLVWRRSARRSITSDQRGCSAVSPPSIAGEPQQSLTENWSRDHLANGRVLRSFVAGGKLLASYENTPLPC